MEKDYRVTYRSREVDPRDADRYDAPRRRIPTALDPYVYPEDRDELKRNVAQAKARNARYQSDEYRDYEAPVRRELTRDDVSTSTRETAKPGATKTTYAVTSAGLEKASEVSTRAPAAARTSAPAPAPVDPAPSISRYDRRERDDYEAPRSATRAAASPYDDRDYPRTERIYETERPRREGGAYVVDLRDVDVIDVRAGQGAQDADRGFAGYRSDPYSDIPRDTYSRGPRDYGYGQAQVGYDDRQGGHTLGAAVDSGGPYISGARPGRAPQSVASRSQNSFRGPAPRTSTRVYDEDIRTIRRAEEPPRTSARQDEDEWGFIERTSARDTRAPSARESFRNRNYQDIPAETPRGRGRGSTYAKEAAEDEYVMVSPPREGAATLKSARSAAGTQQSLRSAMMTENSYTPDERLRRRRSRSISFRDEDARGHERGEGKFVERPGAEAAMMGKHLKSYNADDDRMDYAYSSRRRREPQEGEYEYEYDRRERDSARYAPQRVRSKSRRRRDEEEDDYTSVYQEKTTKTTYY
ncbi:hypothetical protein LTR70_004390 [Exophiala xenobiotica]|uniref:Uncharacterized protein n=1 Tax=Lithohypha guttulata TaxID=1690604 RepID=A0ABR0KJC4_9EURO|nr:hypothetical protein LTR24_001967 [Lithohypha guttulata]KAK5320980.1 hypothetical protein LTR70_004390 [Exophiala xenobiotica]